MATAQEMRDLKARLQPYIDSVVWGYTPVSPSPHAQMLGPGAYGHGLDASIPDTPLDEWNTQVDALLEECRQGGHGEHIARLDFFEAIQRLQRLRFRHGWSWLIDASET